MLTGTRVNRLEDKDVTGATVLKTDGENVLISYDEGGEGWWPISVLAAETPLDIERIGPDADPAAVSSADHA